MSDSKPATVHDVVKFLDAFERPEAGAQIVEGRPGMLGHVRLDANVLDFIDALHEAGLIAPFDWPTWQTTAEGYVNDPTRVAGADLETLKELLTLHVRKERFCEGHLLDMIACGHIQAVLRRLRELTPPAP